MKTLTFFLFICLVTKEGFAQNNLVFDTVQYVSLNWVSSTTNKQVTVPTGKVWKIESVIVSPLATVCLIYFSCFAIIEIVKQKIKSKA